MWKEENKLKKVKLQHVAPTVKHVLDLFPRQTIIKGFQTCGLCPINVEMVKFLNLKKAVVNPIPQQEHTTNCSPSLILLEIIWGQRHWFLKGQYCQHRR